MADRDQKSGCVPRDTKGLGGKSRINHFMSGSVISCHVRQSSPKMFKDVLSSSLVHSRQIKEVIE